MKKLDLNNMSKKDLNKIHTYLRAVIQLLYFIFIPSVYTAAFSGVKYIFTQIGTGDKIGLTSFTTILIVVCLYTIIFGRFFCGFACAFGTLGDAFHALYIKGCKKLKKKPISISDTVAKKLIWIKYIILIAIVVACFAGVYHVTNGYSPWDVFSMIHAGNLKLGAYIPGVIILLLIIIGMLLHERFFCKFLCPMGAVFALLPVLPFFSLRRDRENCINRCSGCTRKCPSNIELPNTGSLETSGECFQCQKCIDICPKGNVHCGIKELKGNEVFFTIFKALLLMSLLFWAGV